MSQIEIIDSTLGKSDSSHFPILFNIARPHQDKLYLIPLFASNLASNTSKISTFPDHSIWNSSWHPSLRTCFILCDIYWYQNYIIDLFTLSFLSFPTES